MNPIQALEEIIEMNRQQATDQYGDAEKAEGWACVKIARKALRENGIIDNTTINNVIEIDNAQIINKSYFGIFVKGNPNYDEENTLPIIPLNLIEKITDLQLPDGDYKITITIQSK